MKKYIIGSGFLLSLVVFFIPILDMTMFELSLFDLVKLGFGIVDSNSMLSYVVDSLQQYFMPYALAIIGLMILIVFAAIATMRFDGKKLKTYSLSFATIINLYLLFMVTAMLSSGDGGGTALDSGYVSLCYGTIVFWIIIYVCIFTLSIMTTRFDTVYTSNHVNKSSHQNYNSHINQISKIEKQPIIKEKINNKIKNSFFGAIIGTGTLHNGFAYLLDDKIKVYFNKNNKSIELCDFEDNTTVIDIYYVPEYEEYCVKVFEKKTVFLKSGQPLGKNRIYYLPRGTNIYINENEYSFCLA